MTLDQLRTQVTEIKNSTINQGLKNIKIGNLIAQYNREHPTDTITSSQVE